MVCAQIENNIASTRSLKLPILHFLKFQIGFSVTHSKMSTQENVLMTNSFISRLL